jgi:hydrogenase maturation factor
MTYVAQFFHAFSSSGMSLFSCAAQRADVLRSMTAQTETEARVIGNFVENMSSLMLGVHDYERRVANVRLSPSDPF